MVFLQSQYIDTILSPRESFGHLKTCCNQITWYNLKMCCHDSIKEPSSLYQYNFSKRANLNHTVRRSTKEYVYHQCHRAHQQFNRSMISPLALWPSPRLSLYHHISQAPEGPQRGSENGGTLVPHLGRPVAAPRCPGSRPHSPPSPSPCAGTLLYPW